MKNLAFHGGSFWKSLGQDYQFLDMEKSIINADVLDAWFGVSPKVIKKVSENLAFLMQTSPPTHNEGLINAISKYRKIPRDNIVVGGGSSDLMYYFFPNILKPKDKVLVLDPMYGEYKHIFQNIISVNLTFHKLSENNDFEIDYKKIFIQIKKEKPNMVVMVNPNSPTGQYWARKNFINLLKKFKKTVFVVDETYIDYINSALSLETETKKYKNLVIIKSMSKVYALSGVRVAYIAANPIIINKFSQFVPPWSVSNIGQLAGIEALKDKSYYNNKYKKTHKLREEMVKELKKTSHKIYNSCANFILIKLDKKSAKDVVRELEEKHIYIRNCDSMSSQFNDNFIRIAVKTKEVNKVLITNLKKIIQ